MRLPIAIVMGLGATAAAAPKLAGNVLVWVDAPMYLDAVATGASVHLGGLDHGRTGDVGHVVPMHVVGESGDFVEVEPTAGIECAWWHVVKPEGLASLRLFVKRGDLAPVIVVPFAASFKDGSRIALQPGVAVVDGKIAFDNGVVHAAVPDANLGLAYAPHAVADPPKPGKHTVLLDENTEVKLGDQSFVFGPWVAGSAERRGDRMLVPIAARCMTAVVSAPKDHVQLDVKLGMGVSIAEPGKAQGYSNTDRYFLPVGTKVTSETGDHVVATLSAELDVAKPTGARACGDFVVTHDEPIAEAPHANDASRPDRTLHLCAPAAAVKVELRSHY
jgi:hypothetical protein